LIAVFFSGTARSADVDTIVLLKSSPFFTDFLKKKAPIPALQYSPTSLINPHHPSLKNKGDQLFKLNGNLYIHFDGSGLLYELQNQADSVLVFQRIDNTENFNYNIAAFLFTNKQDIYNIGGYGFW
jgi:hypothetical protein